jgi:hypothetical protein
MLSLMSSKIEIICFWGSPHVALDIEAPKAEINVYFFYLNLVHILLQIYKQGAQFLGMKLLLGFLFIFG